MTPLTLPDTIDLQQRVAALRVDVAFIEGLAGSLTARAEALRLELDVLGEEPRDHSPVLTVRPATCDDERELLRMAYALLRSPAYAGRLTPDPDELVETIRFVGSQHGCFVAETAEGLVGAVGVVIVRSPLTGERIATEAMWWVDHAYRRGRTAVRLWDCAEAWAQASGAVAMHMVAPAGSPEAGALYARRGYIQLETTWQFRFPEPPSVAKEGLVAPDAPPA